MDIQIALLFIAVLIPSVILHEVMHGWVALRFGDDTAKRAGRLTLNPVRHIDPFGTVILPALLAVAGAGVFGYAKPVPVNPSRMRRPRDHGLIVSLAGPATNIVLAVAMALVLRTVVPAGPPQPGGGVDLSQVLLSAGVVNVVLAAFNLLPIPPLDGSAVVERILPRRLLPQWLKLRRFSMPALLIVVLLFPAVLSRVFVFAIDLWSTLL